MSWFTIQYPDPQGKARGEFGDSHCVFDCKYNLYNPRLDAIAYYNMINGLLDKKFVAEKQYDGGAQAFLFRNEQGKCLQVLWRDEGAKNFLVPLVADGAVELIRIDGSRQKLLPSAGGVKLTLSADPVLLLYESSEKKPADKLSMAGVVATLSTAGDGAELRLMVEGRNISASTLEIAGPPGMKSTLVQERDNQVEYSLAMPASPAAREQRVCPAAGERPSYWGDPGPVRDSITHKISRGLCRISLPF